MQTMQRNRILTWLVCGALIGGTAGLASAQRGAGGGSPFDRADANGDGKVTRDEYVAAREAQFGRMDRNQDGVVSKADFPRAASRPAAEGRLDQFIAEADVNKDGAVSKDELAQASTPAFDRADTNHDGVIDQAEAAAFKASLPHRP